MLSSLELGGAERQALLLARYLICEHQAHVHVWGFGEPGRVAALCDAAAIPWRSISVPPSGARGEQLKALLSFGRQLWMQRPDIVLPYSFIPNIWCGVTWRWSGAKGCIWNQRSICSTRTARWLEQWAVLQTPIFVANSPHLASDLENTYLVPPGRIEIVPNGIGLAHPQADRESWRARIGVDEHTLLVCMIANLTDLKDHDTLLRAWRIVQQRQANQGCRAVLVLAGYFGNRYEVLLSLAEELNISNSIRFLGQVTDVSGLLTAADISILSSRAEGSPNGVLECMAAGLPVVGTDIAGIREAIGADCERFLAPSGDAEVLAVRLLAFLEDSALRAAVGRRNRTRIEEEFSSDRMCERMVTLMSRHLAN